MPYFTIDSNCIRPPSFYIGTDNFTDYIRNEIDMMQMRGTFNPYYDYTYKINLNDIKKETNKMEAKKCDRCGKLYEKKFEKNDIQCVFKHDEPYFPGEEKNYSKELIEDKKTHDIFIKMGGGEYVDMCPDCRKAFKTWFESADKEGKK